MDPDYKTQESRIELIFKDFLSNDRDSETLEFYKKFLNKHLDFPIKLTGIEIFDWEEYYILVPGSLEEYELKKKTMPSYEDIFIVKKPLDFIDEEYGIIADVTRKKDRRKFAIALFELKAIEKNTKNYQLLDDYSVWFVNN